MKYFMTHTPLAGLERQMMTPPTCTSRRSGRRIQNHFHSKPENVALCTEYQHRKCTDPSCPWLAERLESGVVSYQSLVMECFKELHGHPLMDRVEELIRGRDAVHMEGDSHRLRLSYWRSRLTQRYRKTIDHQSLAALYLLTARESLWNKARPHLDGMKNGWRHGISPRGIKTRDYALFQTAKIILGEKAGVTIGDLSDKSVVDDDTLRLIIDSALLCRYGQAALFIGEGAAR